ncbi:hypothetical protein [Nocardioides sp.]|uniref:hypothetical protein n=1 Tax=Nocardioides sp. TaxID=35761 RepID=UPI002ED84C4C
MTTDLREVLHERLHLVVPPAGDLPAVRRAGRRLRRRRQLTAGGAALAVVAAGTAVALVLGGGDGTDRGERGLDPVGQLDFSHGLRAYADPGYVIHLGGREFSARDLEYLDTDATATPYGVVFYDAGHPMLLEESGEFRDLEPGARGGGGHPTAKADSRGALVAYAVSTDDGLEVVVRDLASDDVVGRHPLPPDAVIDALDDGVVLFRTDAGTTAWDTATDRVREVAGPDTRVADVRNGVLLYDGPRPDGPGASPYRLVKGAIDAQLTYDGSHVLYWSNRLESTDGSAPVVLDQRATFFAVDTDGSILAAEYGHPATVYDCEVPSGICTELGPLTTRGGDPAFIGVDM